MGTMRSLLPLPDTVRKPSSRNTRRRSRVQSSLTRSPEPYSVSMMARLRKPNGSSESQAATMASISSIVSTSGKWRPIAGASNKAIGSSGRTLSIVRKRKNDFSPDMMRACERGAMPGVVELVDEVFEVLATYLCRPDIAAQPCGKALHVGGVCLAGILAQTSLKQQVCLVML